MQLHDYTLSIWIGDGFPCEHLQICQETWIQHHWETSQQSWMLMMVFNHFLMKRCDSFVDSIRILRVRNWRKDWFQKPGKPLLISHNSLFGAINTFLCITVNLFFESIQWQHILGWMKVLFTWPKRMSFSTLVLFSGWPGSLQHVWIYGGCQSPQLWGGGGLVLVRHPIWNHRNHITVTFNRSWPPPFMKWVAHHATSCDPSFLDDISLSNPFPSSKKCIWSLYFLQRSCQPLVSLYPS